MNKCIPLSAIVMLMGINCAYAQVSSSISDARSAYARGTISAANRTLQRPTVSPYLRLLNSNSTNTGFGSVQPTYQTMVRPQLEAREEQRMQQAQIQRIQTQLNDVRASNHQQNSGYMATGHPTRFGYYSHYYSMGR